MSEQQDVYIEERRSSVVPTMQISMQDMKFAVMEMQRVVDELFVEGEHYGVIVSGQKPTLYKAGAEFLLNLYGFGVRFEKVKEVEDWDKPFFYYEYKAIVYSKKHGWVEAECYGSANSREKKFAYDRKGNPQPPEYLHSIVNTIQKIAQKRAMVGATLIACRASALFTQDLEDIEIDVGVDAPREQQQQQRRTAQNGKKITEAQVRLVYAKAGNKGIGNETLHRMIKELTGKERVQDLTREDLEDVLSAIDQM